MTLFSYLNLQKDYKTVWIKYLSTVKNFNFRELRVTGLQVWSTISGRSLINNLNRLGLRLSPWRTPMLEENESVTFDLSVENYLLKYLIQD
jgi:hypothetical protein